MDLTTKKKLMRGTATCLSHTCLPFCSVWFLVVSFFFLFYFIFERVFLKIFISTNTILCLFISIVILQHVYQLRCVYDRVDCVHVWWIVCWEFQLMKFACGHSHVSSSERWRHRPSQQNKNKTEPNRKPAENVSLLIIIYGVCVCSTIPRNWAMRTLSLGLLKLD